VAFATDNQRNKRRKDAETTADKLQAFFGEQFASVVSVR
jgi:hypothetical protein